MRSSRTPLALIAACAAVLTGPPAAQAANLVVSQVYAGGGNTGATYGSDFVEIFNRSLTGQSLSGLSVQYAPSGSGTFDVAPLPRSVTLAPGQYLLVQEHEGAPGSPGVPLPWDANATQDSNLNVLGGRVALVANRTPLACGAGPACADPDVIDLIGYGPAVNYETARAPALPNNQASLTRAGSGCTDADNNATDFSVLATAAARNTLTPIFRCTGPAPVVVTCPSAVTTPRGTEAEVPVTAADADGVVTQLATSVNPAPALIRLRDVTLGTNASPGATASLFVSAGTPAGSYDFVVTATNNDGAPQNGTCAVRVTVTPPPPPPPPPPSGQTGAGASVLAPVVDLIAPTTGSTGDSVVVTGSNFQGTTAVLFGDTPARYVINGFNRVTAVAPAGLTGSFDVRVVTPGGTSAIRPSGRFTYVPGPLDTAGSGPGSSGKALASTLICLRVPTLRHRTLTGARRILARDDCRATIHVSRRAKSTRPRIATQSPRPGTPLYIGDRVSVTIR